jgi:hypothetical protein
MADVISECQSYNAPTRNGSDGLQAVRGYPLDQDDGGGY